MRTPFRIAAWIAAVGVCPVAFGGGLHRIRFRVVDPVTYQPALGYVELEDSAGHHAELGPGWLGDGTTAPLDLDFWGTPLGGLSLTYSDDGVTDITVPVGATVTLVQQDQVPVKEITIHVTATRLAQNAAPASTSSNTRTSTQIKTFNNTATTSTQALTHGQAGVAEDSAGQQHIRGEHTEITYVVDGVQLPDTLSGRAGAIVVPNTIQSLEIITGGFAPQFGGQTAGVLNITTLPGVAKPTEDLTLQAGSFDTFTEDLTAEGPLGSKANYVIDLNSSRTGVATEPQQPNNDTAHNTGTSEGVFTKFRYNPSAKDALTLTLSENPDAQQIGNRTGLPDSFAASGEGFGFLGLRNADGSIPGLTSGQQGRLGSQTIKLASQQQDGMDIDQKESNEFGILNYQHQVSKSETAQLALTVLHGGQDLTNNNPLVNLSDLPVDNSIEYNPTAHRNIHHVQLTGSFDDKTGSHDLKAGFLADDQSGIESYQVIPASQLALDELAATDKLLAPAGSSNPNVLDVYGNPVFTATGPAPTLTVERSGYYGAAYAQDTWKTGRLTADYGIRWDIFHQHESISSTDVNASVISPRVNFDYRLDKIDDVRWSYNRLFNTPPLSQGGIVGDPIQPEILNQYDVAFTRQLAKNQSFNIAYYYKDIRDQVDVGLLIPGSEIGLYSAVNFQRTGVHGLETSYDINSPGGIGWDEYLNWTYSTASPAGLDNTGAPAPQFNDHDQRNTVGLGLAYTWKSGYNIAGTFDYGSGLASSIVPPSVYRTPRSETDLHATTGNRLFKGHGGLELDIDNVFDERSVINFDSGFSGTRFMIGRRVTLGANFHF